MTPLQFTCSAVLSRFSISKLLVLEDGLIFAVAPEAVVVVATGTVNTEFVSVNDGTGEVSTSGEYKSLPEPPVFYFFFLFLWKSRRYNFQYIKVYVIHTPAGCGYNKSRNHFLTHYWGIRWWWWTHQRINHIIRNTHYTRQIWGLCTRRPIIYINNPFKL